MHPLLAAPGRIGRRTNLIRLRRKHLFSIWSGYEETCVWHTFLHKLSESIEVEIISLRKPSEHSVDYVCVMAEVVDAEERRVRNIQVTIVDLAFQDQRYDKWRFYGQLSRRRVRLLACGRAYALVILYLNKIILKLNDYRWVRGETTFSGNIQRRSCEACCELTSCAWVPIARRTDGERNCKTYTWLTFARAGELYSTKLRDRLMNIMWVQDRISVEMLVDSAG